MWKRNTRMSDTYEHHGLSGEYTMLPSGEMVPAHQAKLKAKPEPTTETPAPKGKN